MGFSLQAVDKQGRSFESYEYLSYDLHTRTELRHVLASTKSPPLESESQVLAALSFNNGDLVTPEQAEWLARRVTNADRSEMTDQDLMGFLDLFRGFCERCAARGGFEFW